MLAQDILAQNRQSKGRRAPWVGVTRQLQAVGDSSFCQCDHQNIHGNKLCDGARPHFKAEFQSGFRKDDCLLKTQACGDMASLHLYILYWLFVSALPDIKQHILFVGGVLHLIRGYVID